MLIKENNSRYSQFGVSALIIPKAEKFRFYEGMAAGWVDWYGNGTTGHDTTDFKENGGSIKVITNAAGDLCGMYKDITGGDWSQNQFRIWVKATNWAQFAEAMFLIDTAGDFGSFFQANIINKVIVPHTEWQEIVLNRDDFSVGAGTPSWRTVQKMIVRCASTGGATPTAWFNGFAGFQEGTEGFVSVTFDDGWESAYTEGKKKLDEYGFKGNIFVIPELLGGAGYMTEANIAELALQGWEISGHGQFDLTTLTASQQNDDLRRVKGWLDNRGYAGKDVYAYPNGKFTEAITALVRRYYGVARTIEAGAMPTTHIPPFHLTGRSVITATSTATIQGWIDTAYSQNSWLVLVFHKIVTSPAVDTEYSIANFGTVIDYLATKAINVLPVSQALERMARPPALKTVTFKPTNLYYVDVGGATNYYEDDCWICDEPCELIAARETHQTASTSGTLQVEKLTSGVAPYSGTSMLASTMSTAGTANVVVNGVLTTTLADRKLNIGDRVGLVQGGNGANLKGSRVVLTLKRI